MAANTFNCQMDIAFAHTQDGRPELYDFLWEHLPNLVNTLNEKKVSVFIAPPTVHEKWAKMVGMKPVELEHSIQKLMEDKRFETNSRTRTTNASPLELRVDAKQLDHVLNAHNVFLERMLPYLKIEGKNIEINFFPAEKNAVQCFANSQQKPFINSFLVRHLSQAPRVRSVIFDALPERGRGR